MDPNEINPRKLYGTPPPRPTAPAPTGTPVSEKKANEKITKPTIEKHKADEKHHKNEKKEKILKDPNIALANAAKKTVEKKQNVQPKKINLEETSEGERAAIRDQLAYEQTRAINADADEIIYFAKNIIADNLTDHYYKLFVDTGNLSGASDSSEWSDDEGGFERYRLINSFQVLKTLNEKDSQFFNNIADKLLNSWKRVHPSQIDSFKRVCDENNFFLSQDVKNLINQKLQNYDPWG